MKIPKAEKLPSGSWRVRIMVAGERISITAATKKEAEQQAAAIKAGAKIEHAPERMTLDEAITE